MSLALDLQESVDYALAKNGEMTVSEIIKLISPRLSGHLRNRFSVVNVSTPEQLVRGEVIFDVWDAADQCFVGFDKPDDVFQNIKNKTGDPT
ncbi:MAG: hypothetical protein KDK08_05610 [Rhizobiaceae bacterium]|nr:hypothetical protein [Rhizobiaceae bacterium]MCC0000945.1 hypothetical protein [Methylobacteriaceae bacterium]